MAVEIERKFLVHKDKWGALAKGERKFFRQGYLVAEAAKTIRVRLTDTEGFLTIKGASQGASRQEFEYKIPAEDAKALLDNFSNHELEKIRYFIPYQGKTWEVDEFLGENEGLIVAEIELESENETFGLPEWVSKEVTGEEKYYNSYLSQKPFKQW